MNASRAKGISRRSFGARVGMAGLTALASLAPYPSRAIAAPYSMDAAFRLRRLDPTWLWRVGCGSDQWPHVAVDSRSLIAGWGDGWGYSHPPAEAKSAIGFTRFAGSVAAPTIKDLWSDRLSASVRRLSLKPQALLKVGVHIYVYAMGLIDDRDSTRLFRMPLDGSTFTSVAPIVIRKSVEGLQVVGAVHHKPGVTGDIILLLAEHGGLQSADLYVGVPKNPTVWAARATPETVWRLQPLGMVLRPGRCRHADLDAGRGSKSNFQHDHRPACSARV